MSEPTEVLSHVRHAVGKTVRTAMMSHSYTVLLAFEDGSLLCLAICDKPDENGQELRARTRPHLSDYELKELGYLTPEEYSARQAAQAEKNRAAEEKRERALLAQLKAKYEPHDV